MLKTKKSAEIDNKESHTGLKDCFIITPIGAMNSEIFNKADGLIRSVLKPILQEFGFRALPAYEIASSGSITKNLIKHIYEDELVIANLTGLNPNVMYELAIRHSFNKKVVTMAEVGTRLPFDITDQRTIFYDDSLLGSEEVKPRLRIAIEDALDDENVSNPVFDSLQEAAIVNSLSGATDSTKFILDKLDKMESAIGSIRNNNSPRFRSNTPLVLTPNSVMMTNENGFDHETVKKIISSYTLSGYRPKHYQKSNEELKLIFEALVPDDIISSLAETLVKNGLISHTTWAD